MRPYQDKRAGSGGAGHSHVGETVTRGHHQMPMRQRSSGSNPQVRKEQGGDQLMRSLSFFLVAYNVLVVGEHIPGRGGQCIGSGGTHTRQGWTMYW